MEDNNKQVYTRIPRQAYRQLRILAARLDISLAELTRRILVEGVKNATKKEGDR